MYAHSVSPLARDWLGRIHPDLPRALSVEEAARRPEEARPGRRGGRRAGAGFGGREAGAEAGPDAAAPAAAGGRRERDFTTNIRIGSEVFQIKAEGRRKVVLLPWEKLAALSARGAPAILPGFRKLRGKVLFEGFELLGDMRLSTILRILPRLDLGKPVLEKPVELPFSLPQVPADFPQRLRELLRPCRLKKRSSKLGFVSLFSDGQGTYWFRGSRNYLTALKESLYSLETLADAAELPERGEVSALYRELSRELEEL
jgi:hypothetical protein